MLNGTQARNRDGVETDLTEGAGNAESWRSAERIANLPKPEEIPDVPGIKGALGTI